jgi:hypothetical protein
MDSPVLPEPRGEWGDLHTPGPWPVHQYLPPKLAGAGMSQCYYGDKPHLPTSSKSEYYLCT